MICKVVDHNGRKVIDIDGKIFPPLSFKTFRACERNISDFYRAGIKLFCIVECAIDNSLGRPYSLFGESWLDDETYDFSVTDRQIELFIENAPDGYFALMLSVDTRKWWLEKRQGYPDSFRELAKMEADEEWRRLAAKYMQALLRHVEEKYGDRFFGYFIFCGTTTEWFSEDSREEPTDIVREAYKNWCGDSSAEIPDREACEAAEDVIFLDKESDKEVIKYRKFQAWQRTDTILYFANKAQEILEHKKLVGVYFGYIFELHSPRLWNTGYLDYERIFKSHDIDMIANPISYEFRGQNDGSHGMVTDTTLAVHNKICFYEHDQTTSVVPDMIEGVRFVHPNKCATVEEDINLLRRDFLLAMSRGCATWWFDMFGGWFYDKRFMDEIKRMIEITERFANMEYRSESEIAVVVDPESMYYVNKNSKLNEILIRRQKEGLSEIGAPYDLVSACDLGSLDFEKYKLVIFLDQFVKTEESDRAISQLRKEKKTLLFLYAHNIVDKDGNFGIASMNESLGMKLYKNPCAEDVLILESEKTSKVRRACDCFAIEEDNRVTVLGRYGNSKNAAFGYICDNGVITAFSGLGSLNGDALRPLLRLAGVHSYTDNSNAAVYVSSDMIGVYHRKEQDVFIKLKENGGVWIDLFEGGEYTAVGDTLKVPYKNVRTKILVRKDIKKYKEHP